MFKVLKEKVDITYSIIREKVQKMKTLESFDVISERKKTLWQTVLAACPLSTHTSSLSL